MSAHHCTSLELEKGLHSWQAGKKNSRPDGVKSKCGSGDGWAGTVLRGDVVEGRTCPPDPFNDMSFSIGWELQGVGRCKSPAPADIRVAP